MRIRIHDLDEEYHDRFAQALTEHETIASSSPLCDPEDCDALVVFVTSNVTRESIEAMPSLRYIATMSTGFDHIDLEACEERGIRVMNVPSYGVNTVAEHAFALLLALTRKIPAAIDRVRSDFVFEADRTLRGSDLSGKRLGLIGLGRIGSHMARMARGFDMEVVVYDVFPNEELAERIGCRFVSFEELLETSDVISIHIPHNEHTHHLLDESAFTKVKKGALLINTSRGGIVDTRALIRALEDKRLAGAGLDVLESSDLDLSEPDHSDAEHESGAREIIRLLKDPAVIITPHNAFNTREALERIIDTTIDNLRSASGEDPQNVVHGS